MNKLNYTSRTLDDNLIKKGLESVEVLNGFDYSRGLYSTVGGIATQSYIPSKFRRPTADIDLLIGRPLTTKEFVTFSKPVVEFLKDQGYDIETKHGQRFAYHLIIKTRDNQALLIEFSKKNNTNFANMARIIYKELENSRKKKIEGEKDKSYTVCSPEDIVGPKLMRTVNAIKRNQDLANCLDHYTHTKSFDDNFIRERLEEINQFRREVHQDPNHSVDKEIKISADIYDIVLLMEQAGVNEQYFKEVLSRWDTLREESIERDLVFRILLPSFDTAIV
jgi:NACalpha-BTF3-like transcription factor